METFNNSQKHASGKDVYTIITERIIEQLNNGTVPWRQPWTGAGIPRNLISKRPYRGINVMLLAMLGYEHNLFLTSKQLNEIGGSIKPDERPHIVVFWNYVEKELEEGEKLDEQSSRKKTPYLRYYTVFNISQCEGIPEKYHQKAGNDFEPITSCEMILDSMPKKPSIKHNEQKAYYNPLRDYINMPKKTSFESVESYYSTLFHELVHSTGHHSRLNRKFLIEMSEFGSDNYSQEELVAEIGTCYLQSHTGITSQFEQSTAYIHGWLEKLKNDKKFIFTASTYAQKSIDYILNIQNEVDDKHEE